jgi:flagellar basal-body rod modification protein FlgD
MTTIYPGTTSEIISTPPTSTPSSSPNSSKSSTSNDTLASNFTTFLQLLTTQLQNQNPLDPLDTNQFTQQLVQFAQVEQQLKSNDQLASLIELQKATQSSYALGFVGMTVAVDGSTAKYTSGTTQWNFKVEKPSTVNISITSENGQTAYAGSYTVQAGEQSFVWDGKGKDGVQWPEGKYKINITAKDASGQTVGVSTEIEGVVDSVDLTQNPPVLNVSGETFTVDKIKRVTRPAVQNPSKGDDSGSGGGSSSSGS